jgi:biotin carboxyl carrier protein
VTEDVRRAGDDRDPAERAADHAKIDRLADELLPALVAKLAATGLGEIEVREGAWKVRLRRPVDGPAGAARRAATDRPSRAQPGHAGHGHPRAALETHVTARSSTNGSRPPVAPVGPGRGDRSAGSEAAPTSPVATSPAVGIFQPRAELRPGSRVRAGDRLGAVDVLGVPQEVVAPVDGVVGPALVDAGQAVEYGQDLVRIEAVERGPEA